MVRILTIAVVGSMLAFPPLARAQFGKFLEKTVSDTAKRQTSKAINQSADAGYDAAKKGLKEGSNEPQQPPARQQRGSAQPAEARGQPAGGPAEEAPARAGAATPEVAAGDVYSPRFDFVPGDKILYFDDFSDTPPSDYPSRWTKVGHGQAEVVDYQGRHWLRQIGDGRSMKHVENFLRVDLSKALPKKLTIEFDMPRTATIGLSFSESYRATGRPYIWIKPGKIESGYFSHGTTATFVETGTGPFRHVSIAISGTNAKIYSDGSRIQLNPDLFDDKFVLRTIGVVFPDGTKEQDRMIAGFKVAEGGKDYAKDLAVAGRIVTHGITFDTGSDVLKPESGPVLRTILKLLQDDAALRFEVQGHTDNQGGDKVNLPLSARRAAAVKVWLVRQGIEEARLTTSGLGATKPISPNDTLEGRADNRRVEFVKLAGTS